MRLFALCAVALSLLAGPIFADIIEKTDGSSIECKIVVEAADFLTVETNVGGITVRQRIPRKQIKAIRRPVPVGPGYCVIPLEGEIGKEVTAEALKEALAEARSLKATIIILAINSGGGLTHERDAIVGVIRDNSDLTFIAHVTRALSAASTITLACPTIVMAPDATMGAAVVYKITPKGAPVLLEEKYQSAMRALERAACAVGGHDELWARGMREGDLELAIVQKPGHAPRLLEVTHDTDLPENARIIKPRGKILTVTAREAVAWGLANAQATTLGDIRKLLGHRAWHNAGEQPRTIMLNKALAARMEEERNSTRSYDYERLTRQAKALDEKMAGVMEKLSAAEAEFKRLKKEYDDQLAAISQEYEESMSRAKASGSPAIAAKAGDLARQKARALRTRYEPRLQAAREEGAELADQYNVLVNERTKIASTAINDFGP